MLNAILNGKKRGIRLEIVPDDATQIDFKGAEDLLTASIFERLLYLSEPIFLEIVNAIFVNVDDETKPFENEAIQSYGFWPSWYLPEEFDRKRVEPDCFLRFSHIDIIVEAKRWDFDQQHFDQWAREIAAYRHECKDSKTLYFLAVGGFTRWDRHRIEEAEKSFKESKEINTYGSLGKYRIAALTWFGLWQILNNLRKSNLPPNEKRIICDIESAFQIHGIDLVEPVWLKDLHLKVKYQFLPLNTDAVLPCKRIAKMSMLDFLNKSRAFIPLTNTCRIFYKGGVT